MDEKSTTPWLDPLKAERIQLAAPPEPLTIELATAADTEALVAWLSGARCATEPRARVTVDGRRVRIAA